MTLQRGTRTAARRPLGGLYAVTDAMLTPGPQLLAAVAAALRGGAALVQYRDKGGDSGRRQAEAAALLALCRQHGVPLIINDDPELARAVGADGVHLGADDPSLEAARTLLGPAAIVGVSCYDRLETARRAAERGADYLAFGSFFPSPTKPAAVRAEPSLLARARRELALPIVAIGGIDEKNGGQLVALGADLLAVISALFAATDVEAAARRLSGLFADRQPATAGKDETAA